RSLNGRFHGLLVRGHRNEAVLFNDRYGLHRLYWHQSGEALYFAAEAKAILAVCPELAEIDPRSLAEFVTCGCVLENRTLFPQLQILPPGSAWICRNGQVERKTTYFSPDEWEQRDRLDGDQYYQRLRHAFTATLPRYF